MGLDMYLLKRTYVGNSYAKALKREEVKVGGEGMGIQQKRVEYITERVGYWRKANAIHGWFIQSCADGTDDCQPVEVSTKQMEALLALVRKVLASTKLVPGKVSAGYTFENGVKKHIIENGAVIENAAVAQELLPAQEGFFFGSTDYNEDYVSDLRHTEKILSEALAEPGADDCTWFYEASW